ncbi:hypothetical protein B0H19DRAFT_1136476 [Mycena capillaripes]|nr:hypothetical protein B0H19DRAFT_1136476 [Mycena capillaripes]
MTNNPPFPSFSFVLSQAQASYSSPMPSHLVWPQASITPQPPLIPAVVNPNLSPAVSYFPSPPTPQAPVSQAPPRTLPIMITIPVFCNHHRKSQGAPVD